MKVGKQQEQPAQPVEDDGAFVDRLTRIEYQWHPGYWGGAFLLREREDDGHQPAGITRADHRRLTALARKLLSLRDALACKEAKS